MEASRRRGPRGAREASQRDRSFRGSYRASVGGLQGCPPRGVRPAPLAVRLSCSNGSPISAPDDEVPGRARRPGCPSRRCRRRAPDADRPTPRRALLSPNTRRAWRALPPRHLARRPRARGRDPSRLPRRTPRPGESPGERLDGGGRGVLPSPPRRGSRARPGTHRPGPRRLPAADRRARSRADACVRSGGPGPPSAAAARRDRRRGEGPRLAPAHPSLTRRSPFPTGAVRESTTPPVIDGSASLVRSRAAPDAGIAHRRLGALRPRGARMLRRGVRTALSKRAATE